MPRKSTKKRSIKPDVLAKGKLALAKWRAEKVAAQAAGAEAYKKWQEENDLKRRQKKTTPMQAIKQFCLSCVGDIRAEVTNCTARQCPLYIYRPYQKGDDDA